LLQRGQSDPKFQVEGVTPPSITARITVTYIWLAKSSTWSCPTVNAEVHCDLRLVHKIREIDNAEWFSERNQYCWVVFSWKFYRAFWV